MQLAVHKRIMSWKLCWIIIVQMLAIPLYIGTVCGQSIDVQTPTGSAHNAITIRIGYVMDQLEPPYRIGALSMALANARQLNLTQNYTFSVSVNKTNCEVANGTFAGMNLLDVGNVDVIIGPSCNDVCSSIGILATYFNRVYITEKCRDPALDNGTIYPTLMGGTGMWNTLPTVWLLIMQQYRWHRFVLLSDLMAEISFCSFAASTLTQWAATEEAVNANYSIHYIPMADNPSDYTMSDYLNQIQLNGRIVIFCHLPQVFSRFIVAAQNAGMTDSNYAIFTFTDYETQAVHQPWYLLNNSAETDLDYRIEAFYAVKQITLNDISGPVEIAFLDAVREASASQPWYLNSTREPDQTALYLYDAITVYITLVDEIMQNGGDYRDGLTLVNSSKNRHYGNGLSGSITLNSYGDRLNKYAVWTFGPGMKSFHRYLDLDITQPQGQVIVNGQPTWGPRSKIPPLDIPSCGLLVQPCPLPRTVAGNQTTVTAATITVVTVCLSVALIVVYMRSRMNEQKLQRKLWQIDEKEIDQSSCVSSSMAALSSRSAASPMGDLCSGISNEPRNRRMAFYRGQKVHVERVRNKAELKLTRQDLIELLHMKEMNHDNILAFIGASTEPGAVCYITHYCTRGSVQDIIADDEIKLDALFKVSMISDLANGMLYLHKSAFGSHGRLTSARCHVDSRWVLKIGGFGLHAFKEDDAPEQMTEFEVYRNLLWTAPELLRLIFSPRNGTQSGDVYSFAIIVHEITFRANPFFCDDHNPKDLIKLIKAGNTPYCRPSLPVTDSFDLDPSVLVLMDSCWQELPNLRPSFSEIVRTINKHVNNGQRPDIIDSIVRKLEKYAENLETLVAHRTNELWNEKTKTDMLLYRMMPSDVANRLKAGHYVSPEMYDSATVYFSDIVGYTELSSKSSPLEVVNLLNDLYGLFDDTVVNYDVYKVETIGDAYMVVSGLPKPNEGRHICEICNMALNLLSEVQRFEIRHRPGEKLKLRIGIHTGPCAAGVVGHVMPRYCLFGDTINVASRMESTGDALKIHLSTSANEALMNFTGYVTELRGTVNIKGKGPMKTYWLLRRESA